MLKQITFITLLLALCTGCGKQTFPAGRLQQPKGNFSYITPEGWHRTRLAGIEYIIVSTEADGGIKPNIFIEGILPETQLRNAVIQTTEKISQSLREFGIETQGDFATQAGLPGIKIHALHRNKQDLPVATFRYFIQDADRVIAITGTCADAVKLKYEPVFDTAIESLQSERK